MPDERLSDALKVTPNDPKHQEPKNHKLAKRVAFGAAGLAIVAGAGIGVVNGQNNSSNHEPEPYKSTHENHEQEKQEDPYTNLSKQKKVQVEAADKSVARVVREKWEIVHNDANKPTDKRLKENIQNANDKIKSINGDSSDLKSIREAYTDTINIVNDPSLNNLQTAKTVINQMKDSKLSKHLTEINTQTLTKIVATTNHMSIEDVEKQTAPLTAQQQRDRAAQAAKEKAAAASQAQAQASTSSSAQATTASSVQSNSQSQQPATPASNNGQTNTNQNNTAPSQSGGNASSAQPSYSGGSTQHTYQAPASSASHYTPAPSQPAQHNTTPANNNAAQKAASSTPTPTPAPDQQDQGYGTKGANGGAINWGNW